MVFAYMHIPKTISSKTISTTTSIPVRRDKAFMLKKLSHLIEVPLSKR
jgi:hypothetical protein